MHVVIFEMKPKAGQQEPYLAMAAQMREHLKDVDGFISVERFESITEPGKLLSLSFWRDEAAVVEWRKLVAHRKAQSMGRSSFFDDYRLSVAAVERQYTLIDRDQAPDDSRALHG